MPEQYRINERVRFLAEGTVAYVRHAPCEAPHPGALTIAVPLEGGGTYDVTVPLGAVTIERLAPDVQPGQVWQDHAGDLWWSVRVIAADAPHTMMLPGELHDLRAVGDSMLSPEDVNRRYGPITRVYPPAPAPGTGGQAEQPAAPRVMVNDRWKDGDGEIWWGATNAFGEPGLTLGDRLCTWGEVDGAYGPLALIERAGYRPTGGTVPGERLNSGMVVSNPDWVGGAPVRLTAPADGTERAYELLGDGETGVGTAGPGALFTVWEPARNEGAR